MDVHAGARLAAGGERLPVGVARPTTSCAARLDRLGRAAVHAHRDPVAALGRRHAGRERGRGGPPGQRRLARRPGTRCSTSRTATRERELGARRLRLARAGRVDARGRACRRRSWRRSRAAGGRPAWRWCRRRSARAGATTSTARRCRRASPPDGAGWADAPEQDDDGLPVVSMFGTELFPPRLWVYSNFHCNLACDYCVVASSPTARKREISRERFEALVDEAVEEGFTELYVTGGEPFVHPDMVAMAEYASERLRDRGAHQRDAVHGPPRARSWRAWPGARGSPCRARSTARAPRPTTAGAARARGSKAMDGHRLRARAGPAAAGGDDRDARQPRRGRASSARCWPAMGVGGLRRAAAGAARLRRACEGMEVSEERDGARADRDRRRRALAPGGRRPRLVARTSWWRAARCRWPRPSGWWWSASWRCGSRTAPCPRRSAARSEPMGVSVLVMAKAPRAGAVKTRLEPLLGPGRLRAAAGGADRGGRPRGRPTWRRARRLPRLRRRGGRAAPPRRRGVQCFPDGAGDLGDRLAAATARVFARAARAAAGGGHRHAAPHARARAGGRGGAARRGRRDLRPGARRRLLDGRAVPAVAGPVRPRRRLGRPGGAGALARALRRRRACGRSCWACSATSTTPPTPARWPATRACRRRWPRCSA